MFFCCILVNMNRNKKTMLNQDNLDNILQLFGERLTLVSPEKNWDLVVCGGAALAVLNLVQRTTKDIDVIGQVIEAQIEYACFDTKFKEQISIIAEFFNRAIYLTQPTTTYSVSVWKKITRDPWLILSNALLRIKLAMIIWLICAGAIVSLALFVGVQNSGI